MCTVCCLEPWTLYVAAIVAPVQTMFALPQLTAPACEMDTVALLQTPVPSVTVPMSRSWTLVSTSGLLTLALTLAVRVAARAGTTGAQRLWTASSKNKALVRGRKLKSFLERNGFAARYAEV